MFHGTYLPHQRVGIDFMLHRERCGRPSGGLLADEPGLGKTIMTIGLMLENPCFPCLIVCPKAVEAQWASEIKRFSNSGIAVAALGASGGAGEEALPWQVGIVSYTRLSHFQRNRAIAAMPALGRVVFDEGHQLRNPSSKCHKAALLIKAKHVWVLSGTPLVNKIGDVWALLQLLRCAKPSEATPQIACVVRRMLKPIMLRRTMCDIAAKTLPGLSYATLCVPFDSQDEAELYARVEAYCRLRARAGMRSGNDVMVMEALTRCRQMAIHPKLVINGLSRKAVPDALAGELPKAWPFLSTKLRVVTDLVAQHQAQEKVLVLCCFIEEMELIALVLKHMHGLDALTYSGQLTSQERASVVASFCDDKGKARVLLLQVQAGGTGLNLQAASRVIISSMPWTPSLESQGIHRAFRLGQVRKVHVHKVVVADTIDERMLKTHARKDKEAQLLMPYAPSASSSSLPSLPEDEEEEEDGT
ncbi:P-loop containing nucleoside triphosphate hydrolase protein [Scenedesmus sp. NREL 46B-D3]|nr:P-loop containing nucleoside triphosphate hydrolase protein [Scenedesmus sp. NREL 46B-D3]